MAREPSNRRAPCGARPRFLDLIAHGLLAGALILGSTGCPSASVSLTRLPEAIKPPLLRKPIRLVANDDGFFVAQGLAEKIDELYGLTPEDFAALQFYIRQLKAEDKWLRSHPAFTE